MGWKVAAVAGAPGREGARGRRSSCLRPVASGRPAPSRGGRRIRDHCAGAQSFSIEVDMAAAAEKP